MKNILIELLYIVIPLINSIGNITLKCSVNLLNRKKTISFLLLQTIGYISFLTVMGLSYIFLLTHSASLFVIIFSLNYLSTMHAAKWYFGESSAKNDVYYDIIILVGIFIFYCGQSGLPF